MGRPYRVWVLPPNRRNEALDCFVLAYAAHKSEQRERHLAPAALAAAPSGVTMTTPGVSIAITKRLNFIQEMARRMNPPR